LIERAWAEAAGGEELRLRDTSAKVSELEKVHSGKQLVAGNCLLGDYESVVTN